MNMNMNEHEKQYEAKRVSLRWGLECFRLKSKLMQFECGLIANFFLTASIAFMLIRKSPTIVHYKLNSHN